MKRLKLKEQPVASPKPFIAGRKPTPTELEAWADQAQVEMVNALNRHVRKEAERDKARQQ